MEFHEPFLSGCLSDLEPVDSDTALVLLFSIVVFHIPFRVFLNSYLKDVKSYIKHRIGTLRLFFLSAHFKLQFPTNSLDAPISKCKKLNTFPNISLYS